MKKMSGLNQQYFSTVLVAACCAGFLFAGCGQKKDLYSVDNKTQFVETQGQANDAKKSNILGSYIQHFSKNKAGEFDKAGQPIGWWDESNDDKNNAEIEVTGNGSAYITKVSDETWGKVLSDQLTMDLDTTNTLRVVINKIDKNTGFKIMLQQPDQEEVQISANGDGAGVHIYNIADKTGWQGVKTFSVILIVEAEINGVGTLIDELTITEPINNDAYFSEFEGKAGKTGGWWDASNDKNNNALIKNNGQGSAKITKTGNDVWGKVLSDRLTMDVDVFNTLSIVVNKVDEETGFKVMIQESGSAESIALSEPGSGAGVYQYDIRKKTGWSGEKTFNVTLVVEATKNDVGTLVDMIRIDEAGF